MKATKKINVKTNMKTNIKRLFVSILAFTMLFGTFAFCGDAAGDGTTTTVVKGLVDQILVMMRYVGIVVVVIGVGKFALAMKDENPDGQTRAVYYAIAGAILIGLKTIIDGTHVLDSLG